MHGDLLQLRCDGVLVPTDQFGIVEHYWGRWALSPERLPEWSKLHTRVTESTRIRGQLVRYVDVGSTPKQAKVGWLRKGIRAGLEASLSDSALPLSSPSGRARRLVGIPLFGTRAGGFEAIRGQALSCILEEAGRASKSGLDVAIVCLSRADYSALQSVRGDDGWSTLTSSQRSEALNLGAGAAAGTIAAFLGAGVSVAAGLPDWHGLLEQSATSELLSDTRFRQVMSRNPPKAASVLREVLGDDEFMRRIGRSLGSTRFALAHGLIASMRIAESVTTNFDRLYENAAKVPFNGELCVLPWFRRPGRPPWLLKLHGDTRLGELVITSEDYRKFDRDHRVLRSVVQSLLVTRHLVFVGYSMRDRDFNRMTEEVARVLRASGAPHRRVGTVLSLAPQTTMANETAGIKTVIVGDENPEPTPGDARLLEIFLDRMAWRAARHESSWILDSRYEALLGTPAERAAARSLRRMVIPEGDRWDGLRAAFQSHGVDLPHRD
jgi:NAD-dependent SIR2 family protein deacetylase